MTDPMLRKLARQLVTVDKRVRDLETVPQLAHSSIDDGALPIYDAEGTVVAKVGKQDDGTWGAPPLQGPTPPAPRGVTATGGSGTINVAWTGEFVRDAAPLDFDTLEVLVDGVLAGAIPNRDGGTVSIAAEQGYRFVAARIRTLVPRHSATTSPFSVEVGPPADQLFLDAREAIEAAEGQIQDGKDALDAERLAREQALQDAAQNLQDLADELATMPSSEELAAIRGEVAAAQEAVEGAQSEATAATAAAADAQADATAAGTAAANAEANALAAIGVAADKGRIFYQATAPTGDDRSPNNLWIDSDDGAVYVWDETAQAWVESESESLRDAAQAAVAAQQAADAADQKAQDAASAAAEADRKAVAAADAAEAARQAAADAQKTADDATIDAREAHNEAVAAADRIQAKIAAGDSILLNGSFEDGDSGWPTGGSHAGRSRIFEDPEAHTGAHSLELTPTGANAYPESDFYAVRPGGVLYFRAWVKRVAGEDIGVRLLTRQHDGNRAYLSIKYASNSGSGINEWGAADLPLGEWVLIEGDVLVPDNSQFVRAAVWTRSSVDAVIHADDLFLLDVTEARAAQARAEEAYTLAESKPGMDEVNQAIVVSSNGKNAITVSTSAPTSSTPGAVLGDTWWQVDAAGDIFGQWSWSAGGWRARVITSDVIANLDVGKLTVTGTSRFTKAVVDRLFADIFTAHKITANELTIAALDENGEIKPDSVEAVMIKDGQISANKILLLGDPNDPDEAALVATIASIMKLAVENLVVTDGAVIDFAVIEKLATQMVTAGVIRTADEGQRVVIDQSGIVMYGLDPDGNEFELVRIGPSGDNLITAGDTTISPAGVQAPSGSFEELAVGGDDLSTILDAFPRGIVAWGDLTQNSDFDSDTSRPARRAELQTRLEPKRLYRISLSSHYLDTSAGSARAVEELRYSFDYTPIFPTTSVGAGTYRGSQYRHYITGNSVYIVPGQEFMLNTDNWDESHPFWLMWFVMSEGSNWPVRVVARRDYAPILAVEDLGPSQTGLLKRWNDNNGGGSQDTTPQPVRYTKTYSSNGYRCYNLDGSDAGRPDVVHGLYSGGPSRFRRRGGWTFPNMTNDLSGASVEKVEMYIYCNHTHSSAGSTVRPAVWGGNMASNLTAFTTINGWKRNTGRWITIPSSYYNGFKSGSYAGVGVIPSSDSATQFARFDPTGAKIRITYTK